MKLFTNSVPLAHSYCHYYSLTKAEDGISECAAWSVKVMTDSFTADWMPSDDILSLSVQVLQSSFDYEAKFRVLVGIGSLVSDEKLNFAQLDMCTLWKAFEQYSLILLFYFYTYRLMLIRSLWHLQPMVNSCH